VFIVLLACVTQTVASRCIMLMVVQFHIVHWNTDLCPSVTEAMKSATGLGVLCVFLQVR